MKKPLIPLKVWIILREDITYTYNRILNIGLNSSYLIEGTEEYNEWRKRNITKTYMTFNLDYLYQKETYLINNGIKFEWIYENKVPVGIITHPTRKYLTDNILRYSLTLEEYSKHHISLLINEIEEK